MQVASSQFATAPVGHRFVARRPLAKPTAKKCAECGQSVFEHMRSEVAEADLARVLEALADDQPSVIVAGELLVGSYKSVIREAQKAQPREAQAASADAKVMSIANTAGKLLHEFLPSTRAWFDTLRSKGLLLDVEWQDADDFSINQAELLAALHWMRERVGCGQQVLVNCAQGKSRSATLATAYIMARNDVGVSEALAIVQQGRKIAEPNAGFLRQLAHHETTIRGAFGSPSPSPSPSPSLSVLSPHLGP